MMSHFPSKDWVNLVRGVSPIQQQALIERHLEQGCEVCRIDSQVWRMVSDCLSREASYQVPESVLRIVKAAYPSEKSLSWLRQIAEMAQVVFDSWQQPGAAVSRTGQMRFSRQVIHEAEPFVIDLRIEADPGGKRVQLTGQILNSWNPDQEIEAVDVILLSGDHLVVKTSANAKGEFDVDFEAQEELHLFINIRGQRAIGIPLPRLERSQAK